MGFRSVIATSLLNNARKIGRSLGCELVVETSDHSIKTTMEVPSTKKRAWDPDLFKRGQLYYAGYANPYKPRIRRTPHPKDEDTIDVEMSDVAADGGEERDRDFELVPSYRYRKHQDQHLISELVNPTEQWQLLVYGILALGGLMFFNMILVLYATGSFA